MPLAIQFVWRGCRLLNKLLLPVPPSLLVGAAYHSTPVRTGTAFYVDHELAAAAEEEAKTILFPVRHVEFTTCPTINGEKAASKEMKFKAAYVDSHPGADASVPTVVTVHGAPGSHLDFKHVINSLPTHNMRVISLNFPGFNWTPMDSKNIFWHTTLEKTAFLADFLENLKLSKVDVLVGHSAGSYPAVRLCANTTLVQSLLLVNPISFRVMKSVKPLWYLKMHSKYCRIPIIRNLLLPIHKVALVIMDLPIKDALLMSTAVETITRFDYKQQEEAVKELARKKFPVFIMYSENDHGVEVEASYECAMMLGGSPARMQHYDSQGELVQSMTNEGNVGDQIFRGYVFEKGGHFLTKRHPDIVNQAILDLHNTVKHLLQSED